jgi:hypothetical protein
MFSASHLYSDGDSGLADEINKYLALATKRKA